MEVILTRPNAWLFFLLGIFFAMLLFLEIGRRWGKRRLKLDPQGARIGVSSIEGAIYALFGLLLAFSFSGAASRFDARRHLVVEEANHISTAYLRLDLLPPSDREQVRSLFHHYVEKRLETYQNTTHIPQAEKNFAEAEIIQKQIWQTSVAACQSEPMPSCTMALLPSLNAMFDIANTRLMATKEHPPVIIFLILISLGLICSMMAGFAMAEASLRHWFYWVGFALIITITTYVILDLEFPRLGFIRVDSYDEALHRVLKQMN